MDGNGFTGFNPTLAWNNIMQTADNLYTFVSNFSVTLEEFFHELSTKWASPNAVDFWNSYSRKVQEAILYPYLLFNSFEKAAVEAYNKVSTANGMGSKVNPFSEFDPMKITEGLSTVTFSENYNGIVGMNILLVKELLNSFTGKLKELGSKCQNIDLSVAFYDANGEMASAYKNGLTSVIKNSIATMEEIISQINSAMEKETDSILLAKSQSVDALS